MLRGRSKQRGQLPLYNRDHGDLSLQHNHAIIKRSSQFIVVFSCLLFFCQFLFHLGHSSNRHPIARLIDNAETGFEAYDRGRYRSFREVVAAYRSKYQRHPPPGFDEWYRFARERNVYLLDDFEQVHDDIRPFWGLEPLVIRSRIEELKESSPFADGLATLPVRNGSVPQNEFPHINWRLRGLTSLVSGLAKYLPDMDIILNTHDQPRVVVPWEEMQEMLEKEAQSRKLHPNPTEDWTRPNQSTEESVNVLSWIDEPALERFAVAACPPDSPARKKATSEASELTYKEPQGGFITNFNLSTDLCTIGPQLWHRHGILFNALTLSTSQRLIPVFGEAKTGVHSDILFPGPVYWKPPTNYAHDPELDLPWSEKYNTMLWRGTNSGGRHFDSGYLDMHRSRLVLSTKADLVGVQPIVAETKPLHDGDDVQVFIKQVNISAFASEHADVAFNGFNDCGGNCYDLNQQMPPKPNLDFKNSFKYKYLVDVDGHAFSPRWRAFLQSKCLGIKSTIFRDWHDSRMFAWKHFIPLDNRYTELWNILTYFVGYENLDGHDAEAEKMALDSQQWSQKVLRAEDMEIYMFRLLLEYARVLDDNRDSLGYGGDGSEFDQFDQLHPLL